MKSSLKVLGLICLVVLVGCNARTDKADSGGVVLSVTDFDELPAEVSVQGIFADGSLALGSITLESHAANPAAGTSDLMNVEMDSYEVTFSRADVGTILPPPLVQKVFGVTPIDGTNTYDNLRILTAEQILARPIRDLLLENGAFDKETGQQFIRLNFVLRFFGRTLAGKAVESAPVQFTVQFVP